MKPNYYFSFYAKGEYSNHKIIRKFKFLIIKIERTF